MLKVPVCVEGIKLEAVVDTAAQVTLISDQVYHKFREKPPVIKNISLNTAGRQMKLPGAIIGPVKLKLGRVQYFEKVYVAPIEDDIVTRFRLPTETSGQSKFATGSITASERNNSNVDG